MFFFSQSSECSLPSLSSPSDSLDDDDEQMAHFMSLRMDDDDDERNELSLPLLISDDIMWSPTTPTTINETKTNGDGGGGGGGGGGGLGSGGNGIITHLNTTSSSSSSLAELLSGKNVNLGTRQNTDLHHNYYNNQSKSY